MFVLLVLFILSCFLLSITLLVKKYNYNEYVSAKITCGIFYFIIIMITITSTMKTWSDHIKNSYKYYSLSEQQELLEEKSNILVGEFKYYLADLYPNMEKEIIESVIPEKLSILAFKYPELKSSETIINLVQQLNDIREEIYELNTARVTLKFDMQFKENDPRTIYVPKIKLEE